MKGAIRFAAVLGAIAIVAALGITAFASAGRM
jgi:hypothetical protein